MRLLRLRRLLTWTLATLLLVGLAFALAIVWTANERQWYVDTAGIDLTLDMTLTTGGRLVLTALLVGLMALALATIVVEAVSRRAPRRADVDDGREVAPPVVDKTFTYRDAGHGAGAGTGGAPGRPGRYESMIVGKTDARRAEGTLPTESSMGADETETIPPKARRVRMAAPARPYRVTLGPSMGRSEAGPLHGTHPLRGGDRR
jgi:hypothetical protein